MSIHEEECDESDPFASFGDDLCDTLTSERKNPVSTYSRAPRNWGIPTFQEQIDKNITSFTLKRLDDPSKDIVIQLQHRLHSTGSDLWDSALVLAHALPRRSFLEAIGASVDNADDWFKNLNVLELGSGTGALGLYCSKCMGVKHVTMTDLSANLPLIENNTEKNSPTENITICPLDWTQELDKGLTGYDLIIGTDLFLPFAAFLLQPLAATIAKLLRRSKSMKPEPRAIICYEERFDCSQFFEAAEDAGLRVRHVPSDSLHPNYQDPGRIHVLLITLR